MGWGERGIEALSGLEGLEKFRGFRYKISENLWHETAVLNRYSSLSNKLHLSLYKNRVAVALW